MKPSPLESLDARIAALPPGALCVGFSGGVDSTVLLHRLAASAQARARGLRALHVDHSLHADSARWAEHCRRTTDALRVPSVNVSVTVDRTAGTGPEDAARRARMSAFAKNLHDGEILVLAHHRDDQAETVLLKLLRGAGPEGLGGMRDWRTFARGFLWRPLLDIARSDIADYAKLHSLAWRDDPSNADTHLRRNYLRHEILPRLTQRWSDASTAISHSATWLRAASDFIDTESQTAHARLREGDRLNWRAWLDLPDALRDATLRRWLREFDLSTPAFFHVAELERQLRESANDRAPCVRWPGCEVRRYRDWIYAMYPSEPIADWSLEWRGGDLELPTGEILRIDGNENAFPKPLVVCNRRGGERIRLAGHAHHRDVRLLLQEAGIPPWLRAQIPMIFDSNELVAVGEKWVSDAAPDWLTENGARIVVSSRENSRDRH